MKIFKGKPIGFAQARLEDDRGTAVLIKVPVFFVSIPETAYVIKVNFVHEVHGAIKGVGVLAKTDPLTYKYLGEPYQATPVGVK